MDDRDAIRRMKKGEIGGLEVLVNKYQVRAVRTAFFITQDEALAEDVVQDTFVRLYQRIRRFDEKRAFQPYLMRSVVNAALNAVRQRGKQLSFDADPAEVEGRLADAISVESEIEFRQKADAIIQSLSKLSPRERAVIVQRYYLEMSEAEMAQKLDVAPGTIKWLLHTARRRLRELLGSERSAR